LQKKISSYAKFALTTTEANSSDAKFVVTTAEANSSYANFFYHNFIIYAKFVCRRKFQVMLNLS
jgi:hypothetical protein